MRRWEATLGAELAGWPDEAPALCVVLDAQPETPTAAGLAPCDVVTVGPASEVRPLASVTKAVVAYALLVAVEEGSLDLDQPVWLEDRPPTPAVRAAGDSDGAEHPTVRHLLAHASGCAPDQRRALTAPGTRRIYSNAGFEILADLLEEATGLTAATYVDEAVCQPLGMSSTVLTGSAAHGMRSTAADLARFACELLQPTILAPTTFAATTAVLPHLAGVLPGFGLQDPNPWGLGFEIRGDKSPHWTGTRSAPETFGHFGRSGTFLWVDPRRGIACTCLTTTPFGPWAVAAWPRLADLVISLDDPGRRG